MPSRSMPIAARERLRAQQDAEVIAVAAHGTTIGRLNVARAKRADMIVTQDELVAAAETQVAVSAAGVVKVSGLERAAVILGVSTGALRKMLAAAKVSNGSNP